ncbi:MAG TPA: hypothetical protein DEQ34_13150 [Balneolaceae bacterium]|nr:hypothetical protein [Balneolaceae bacterium]|tara:strand:- start:3443 stop:4087 length:645 start_codon:yes stop_codon:yes gene_type:complete
MRILVLGASGGCGKEVVKQATSKGYEITSVVRPQTEYEAHEGETVLRGSVLDKEFLQRAVKDVGAVISCLGLNRKNQTNPWSDIVSPVNLTSEVASHLVELLSPKTKVVVISAGGVHESFSETNLMIRFLIRTSSLGPAYRDLENMEEILHDSDLDWLAVRPVTLTNGTVTNKVKITVRYSLFSTISRGDVAAWMLDALERKVAFHPHTEMIRA